ncbi:MAG: pilus assembly protein PilM [Patescibacteria group bacterium]
MGLFTKSKSVIGIDIGADSVKMVQLAEDHKKPTLVTYGMAEDSIDIVRDTSEESTAKLVYIIKQIVEQSRMSSPSLVAALPTFSVFSSILSLPAMPKKDLAQAVRWEAKKFVPMPLEEMILDWKELKSINQLQAERSSSEQTQEQSGESGEEEQEKKVTPNPQEPVDLTQGTGNQGPAKPDHLRVLITAAPKSLVSRYVDVVKSAGLQLANLETEAFAIARSLTGAQRGTVMIVDIGSITTDIIVIEDGIPIMNRSIDVGGKTLTQAIAQSLHIDPSRAEQFKRDIGVNQAAGSAIPRVMKQTLQPILQEISYSHNLYQSQTNQPVDKIVLTGGSALLPSMDSFLAEVTNINTYLGDPWMHIGYPEDLKPVLDEIGSRLPVAIGLALKPMMP